MDELKNDALFQLNWAIEHFKEEKTPSYWDTIHQLLRDHPELAGMADEMGEYPLHKAANYGCEFAITRLLEAGAEVDAVTENDRRETPLHLAAHNGHADACRYLADAGADLTRRAADGFTPLLEAIYRHQAEVVGTLLRLGAPMDLRVAVNLRQRAIVGLMLRDNPDLVRVEPDATNLVAEAALCGDIDVLRLLLEAGADPNTARVSAHSLYNAVFRGDRAAVELLLAYGADPDREVSPGATTARQYADQHAAEEVRAWALNLFSPPIR